MPRVRLEPDEARMLTEHEHPALAMAMRIVLETARIIGAERLVEITSVHADGCLYHGDSGVLFLERLVELGGSVQVPTTLNVGALDLEHPELMRADPHTQHMARRLMDAHVKLGCEATWTCAPYQAGHRPTQGEQIAWAESNAVVFANSVLGARTNRYGDFLDICAALTGRAPYSGLHVRENRRATVRISLQPLSSRLRRTDAFYPVLGAWLGRELGAAVAVLEGVPADVGEDCLKALGAGAAATGAVGLFHVLGVTPEASTLEDACQGQPPLCTVSLTAEMVRAARDALSTAARRNLDCICLGSPHYSFDECLALARALGSRKARLPIYVCTHRVTVAQLASRGLDRSLVESGVTFIVDTCVVVTPILRQPDGVMMTNSAKFAHYAKGNTGYDTVFGSLADCVESAVQGQLTRDETLWQ